MKHLMKMIYATAALIVLTSGANGMTLSNGDESYVVAVTAAAIVADQCNAKLVKDSAMKLADKTGTDLSVIGKAVLAAVNANMNQPYNREDLIPEVTITMRKTASEIAGNMRRDHSGACLVWVGGLRFLGMVE